MKGRYHALQSQFQNCFAFCRDRLCMSPQDFFEALPWHESTKQEGGVCAWVCKHCHSTTVMAAHAELPRCGTCQGPLVVLCPLSHVRVSVSDCATNLLRLFSELRVISLLPHAVLVYVGPIVGVWVSGVHTRACPLKSHSPSIPFLRQGEVHIVWSRRTHIFSNAILILPDGCYAWYVPSARSQVVVSLKVSLGPLRRLGCWVRDALSALDFGVPRQPSWSWLLRVCF